MLSLDHIEAIFVQGTQQREHVVKGADALSHKATAPVIGAEGLGEATREDLDASVSDHLKAQHIIGGALEASAEHLRGAARLVPIEEDIDADELLLGALTLLKDDVKRRGVVLDGLKRLGRLS